MPLISSIRVFQVVSIDVESEGSEISIDVESEESEISMGIGPSISQLMVRTADKLNRTDMICNCIKESYRVFYFQDAGWTTIQNYVHPVYMMVNMKSTFQIHQIPTGLPSLKENMGPSLFAYQVKYTFLPVMKKPILEKPLNWYHL